MVSRSRDVILAPFRSLVFQQPQAESLSELTCQSVPQSSGWSATLPEPSSDSGIWFDSDAIIDRRPNPLLAAKVSLGCLNRDMSQQELDLLQFLLKHGTDERTSAAGHEGPV